MMILKSSCFFVVLSFFVIFLTSCSDNIGKATDGISLKDSSSDCPPCRFEDPDGPSGNCDGVDPGGPKACPDGSCIGENDCCEDCGEKCEVCIGGSCQNPGGLSVCGDFCCDSSQTCKSTFGVKYCKDNCQNGQVECQQTCCNPGECKKSGGFIKVGYCLDPDCPPEDVCAGVDCCEAGETCDEVKGYPACISNDCPSGQEVCSGTYGSICCDAGTCIVNSGGYPYCNG
ncbi:hypothetical protein H6503_02305 [Candidatus Woesearchaeota archaeon]|nr:hypothetical protein [Candidatus Woesearchaeota archaeon]